MLCPRSSCFGERARWGHSELFGGHGISRVKCKVLPNPGSL
jgi:hypothetical protein